MPPVTHSALTVVSDAAAAPASPLLGAVAGAVAAAERSGLNDAVDRGLIRVIARDTEAPILQEILAAAAEAPEAARPEIHVLTLGGETGLSGVAALRRLDARGAQGVREQALFGGARLWTGDRLGAPSLPVDKGRFADLFDLDSQLSRPDLLDIARLTFGSAWALSTDPATPQGWSARFGAMLRAAAERVTGGPADLK